MLDVQVLPAVVRYHCSFMESTYGFLSLNVAYKCKGFAVRFGTQSRSTFSGCFLDRLTWFDLGSRSGVLQFKPSQTATIKSTETTGRKSTTGTRWEIHHNYALSNKRTFLFSKHECMGMVQAPIPPKLICYIVKRCFMKSSRESFEPVEPQFLRFDSTVQFGGLRNCALWLSL